MAKRNAFLDRLQAKADAKGEALAHARSEIDAMALLLSTHDTLQVGPGRAPKVLHSFDAYRREIAEAVVKEYNEDLSKKKEVVVIRRNLAKRLKEILGPEGWDAEKKRFPFLREYWG